MTDMKNLKYIFAAILPMLLISCKVDEYVPGEADLENCYGVYFPAQSTTGLIMLEPMANANDYRLPVKVSRINTEDDITVPIDIISDADGVFYTDQLEFVEGQADATIYVYFEDAEESVEYSCKLQISDPKYALIYGTNPTYLTFSLTIAKWNPVSMGDDHTAIWKEDLIKTLYGTYEGYTDEVKMYEQEGKKGYYRLDGAYSSKCVSMMFTGNTDPANVATVEELGYTKDASIIIDATNPEKIFIPYQNTGICLNKNEGDIWIGSYVEENFEGVTSESYGIYNKENGMVSFPNIYVSIPQLGYAALSQSSYTTLIFPGYQDFDYSLRVINGHSYTAEDEKISTEDPDIADVHEGEIPIWFIMGEDIENVKFEFIEGVLGEDEIEEYALKVDKQNDAFTIGKAQVNEKTGEAKAVITPKNARSGMYTLVAVGYDKDNDMQTYTHISFGYVAAGAAEEAKYRVICDAGLIVSNKYAPMGLTAENSLEYYINGENLTQVQCILFKKNAYTISGDALINLVASSNPVNRVILDQINNGGYIDVTGAEVGTEYILIVVASNGYRTEYFLAEAKTEGEFNLTESYWSMYDIDFIERGKTLEEGKNYIFSKDWDYWAVNVLADEETYVDERLHVGTVKFSEHEDRYEGETDETAERPDTVCVNGLLATAGKDLSLPSINHKFNDTIHWQYIHTEGTGGLMATLVDDLGLGYAKDGASNTSVYVRTEFINSGYNSSIAQSAAMVCGIVKEGVLAVVESGISGDYYPYGTFYGMALAAYSDPEFKQFKGYLLGMGEMLLFDPALYPTDEAKTAAYQAVMKSPQIDMLRTVASQAAIGPRNMVETWDGGLKSTIEYMAERHKAVSTIEGRLCGTHETVEFDMSVSAASSQIENKIGYEWKAIR